MSWSKCPRCGATLSNGEICPACSAQEKADELKIGLAIDNGQVILLVAGKRVALEKDHAVKLGTGLIQTAAIANMQQAQAHQGPLAATMGRLPA